MTILFLVKTSKGRKNVSCKNQVVTFNWKKNRKTTQLKQVTLHICSHTCTYLTPDKIEVSAVEHKMIVKITKNCFESKTSFFEFYLI